MQRRRKQGFMSTPKNKVIIMIEKTFVLVKPDGVARGLVGEILKRIENSGMKIAGLKMVWVKKEFAEEHYKAHKSKEFFDPTVKFITEGPVVAMVVEGVHAIQNIRRLVGPTSPNEAAPGTIRGDYAHISMKYASSINSGGKNLIHASDSAEVAKQEIALWFKPEEIHSYKTVHQEHTL